MTISADEVTEVSHLSAAERRVYDLLSPEPVQFEDLCTQSGIAAGDLSASLVILELDGLVTRLDGARYVRPRARPAATGMLHAPTNTTGISGIAGLSAANREAAETVAHFIQYIYGGISRKYLQNYAAAHWCHIDRKRWGPGKLLRACVTADQITASFIREYVTPLMVRCAPVR